MQTFAWQHKRPNRIVRNTTVLPYGSGGDVQRAVIGQNLRPNGTQAKLTVGAPDDAYEQEADRVADAVMRTPEEALARQPQEEEEEELLQTKPAGGEACGPELQRQALPEKEEEESIQAKKSDTKSSKNTGIDLQKQVRLLKDGGQPLPISERTFFESRMNSDFSQVRVHSNHKAAQTAKAINAHAFTIGRDVVFGQGQYSPGSRKGKSLLAHELTHVLQQTGGDGSKSNKTSDSLYIQARWKRVGRGKTIWEAKAGGESIKKLAGFRMHGGKRSNWPCLRPLHMKKPGTFGAYASKGDKFDSSMLVRSRATTLSLQYFSEKLLKRWGGQWYGATTTFSPEADIRKPATRGSAIRRLTFMGHGFGRTQIGPFKLADTKDPAASYPNAKAGIFPNKCLFAPGAKARFVGCATAPFAKAFAKQFMRKGSKAYGTKKDIYVEIGPGSRIVKVYDPLLGRKVAKKQYVYRVVFTTSHPPHHSQWRKISKWYNSPRKFHASRYWSSYRGKR
jgi:hypothetical protein